MKKKLKNIVKIVLNTVLAIVGLKYPIVEVIVEKSVDEIDELLEVKNEKRPRNSKGQFISINKK